MDWAEVQITWQGVFALLGAVAVVGGVVNLIRGWLKPGQDRDAKIDQHLATDKARLDAHEKQIDALQDGMRVLCKGVQTLLEHELHNGNASELQEASNNLSAWLINR